MAHFFTSIDCQATPEVAFDYLSDFANAAEWDPTVTRVEGEAPGVGARFRVFLGSAGLESSLDYRTLRFEPGRHLTFQAETPILRSLDTIDLEPTRSGCRVHYDADLRFFGAAKLIDLPAHWAFQISGRRSVAGLERALRQLRPSAH